MRHVIFVAPFFLDTTLRFVSAGATLPGVRLSLISQDPAGRLPERLRQVLSGHRQIRDGLDPRLIAAAARSLGEELGPPWRLLGALEQLQVPLAIVRQRLGVPGLGVAAARNFRDKARMKRVLEADGVPCARHGLVETADEARALAERLGLPLVAKPPAGAGARNTFRINDAEALRQCLAAVPPRPGAPLLLEEFVTGEEHSFDAISIGGKPVWHSLTHYLPGPLEVLENPWIQWCVLLPREVDHPRYDDIRRVAFHALDALGMGTGLSHMEWFRRPDGSVAVSEVGARPPGAQFTTLMSYAHDLDFYRAWVRLMVFDEFEPPHRAYAAGLAFLRGQGRGRVRAIHGLEAAQREIGSLVVDKRLPEPGRPASTGYEGDGWVVLRHTDTATVARALRRLVELVRVELVEDRR